MNMNTDKVIEQARSWLGITEYENRFVEIVNAYNEIPGARGPAVVSYPWCAIFVSAVYWKALGESRFAEMACDQMIVRLQNLGVYSVTGTPSAGDIIFYDWDSNGTSDHVGIVTEVTESSYIIIEGNKSDSVSYRTISPSYPHIKGFGFVTKLDEESSTVGQQMSSIGGQQMAETDTEPKAEAKPSTIGQTITDKITKSVTLTIRRPILEKNEGKYSDEVKRMQALLIAKGYDVGRDGADGYFGNNTYLALYKMQRDHAKITGICDKESWVYLEG